MKQRNRSRGTIVLVLFVCLTMLFTVSCGKTENSKPAEGEKSSALTVDEVMNNLDKFLDKEITIVGYAPKQSGYGMTSDMNEIYSEDFSQHIDLSGIDKAIENCYEITVTGILKSPMEDIVYIEVKDYRVNEDVVKKWPFEESESNSYYDGLTLEDKRYAVQNYSNMDWDSFYRNPTSFADDQLYYFVGKVIDDDGDSGLMCFVEGDDRTLVQYIGTDLDFLQGDIVAVYATVSDVEGSWINTDTGDETTCPRISIVDYQIGTVEISSLSDEEENFVYDSFSAINGSYITMPGKTFTFGKDKISGYPYTVRSMEYFYGDSLVSSYQLATNNMKIIMSIDVEDGENTHLLMFFNLDGSVSVKTDDYETKDYERI